MSILFSLGNVLVKHSCLNALMTQCCTSNLNSRISLRYLCTATFDFSAEQIAGLGVGDTRLVNFDDLTSIDTVRLHGIVVLNVLHTYQARAIEE